MVGIVWACEMGMIGSLVNRATRATLRHKGTVEK